MPEKATVERARRDKREGKAASTQAGEFCPRRWRDVSSSSRQVFVLPTKRQMQ